VGLAGYCAWRLDVINRLGWAGFSYVPPVGKTSTAQPLMGLQPGSVFMVFPGAPAERAGLRRGDIIFGINGIPASDLRRLNPVVSSAKSGDVIRYAILRDGRPLDEVGSSGPGRHRPCHRDR